MKKILVIIALVLVLQALISNVFLRVGMLFMNETDVNLFQQSSLYYWILGAALISANVLLVIFVYLLISREDAHPLMSYLTLPRVGDLILVLATFLCLMIFVNGLIELFPVEAKESKVFNGMVHNGLCILDLVVFSAFAEEICFRRGILGLLLKNQKVRRYALVLSALIYGVLQLNPPQMLGSFVLGLFFGWLYIRTHSITFTIICHMVNNLVGIVLGLLLGQGTKLIDCFPNALSFYIVMGILAIAGSIFFRISQKKIYKAPSFSE
jgi:membrane protease YdiL (CAAX protease family)